MTGYTKCSFTHTVKYDVMLLESRDDKTLACRDLHESKNKSSIHVSFLESYKPSKFQCLKTFTFSFIQERGFYFDYWSRIK